MGRKPKNKQKRRHPQKSAQNLLQNSSCYSIILVSTVIAVFSIILALFGRQKEASSGIPSTLQGIMEAAKQRNCTDQEDTKRCASMALNGQCDSSPGWMAVMCPASCNICELRDPNVRCDRERIGMSSEPAFESGDLSNMFETLPERLKTLSDSTMTYLLRPPEGPYIVHFSKFLSDEEVDALLRNVGMLDLKRSTDQGKFQDSGFQEQVVSKSRTSENAWCMAECQRDPIVQQVQKRISDLVLVPQKNFESFQMLRYQIGQEYKRHHDMSPESASQLCGPRILTFFLYLSDVEEGGATMFTDLDPPVAVKPKRGDAILWPSVLDEDPMKQDILTFHQAMPVTKGTKFAANTWIHLYDYVTPNFHGCTGSFA